MTESTKICRACLTGREYFSYVLGENVSEKMYLFCTAVEVHEDNLPKTLCDLCYENLVKYSEFKNTCIQSHNALSLMKDVSQLTCNISNYQSCAEELTTVAVKTEDVSDDIDRDILPIKEDILTDFNESMDGKDNNYGTINKRNKRRKLRKLQNRKVKLKKARNPFNFSCVLCNKKFNYLETFEAHKLEHEGKEVLIHCLQCNKSFMTWSGLRRHNASEHTLVRLDKLKCSTCGKICKSQQTLSMHQKIHEERKIYVCDVCGKGYTTKFNLKAHLETHKENRERLFTCEHCGKKFYTNTILLSHVSRRHTDRRFICQICNYPFTDKYNLSKHLLIHEGKKLFKCEICNKSYRTHSSLVEHKRIHSGERPFICSYCPKRFLSKRRLDDHHKIHTGEKPHKCDICGQGFTQRGTLKRHMKVHDRTLPVLN